jgi:flagellin
MEVFIMRINHNIASLNTYRQLSANTGATSKSLEKLSSGLAINRAGDNAAGLAISEKMRGQIRGLDQAATNAQDSISLIQTAEGALSETHSILQRMRELAVQAANDTNTVDDREEIQKEINQLTSEIDRIGTTTEFNTKKLLNGDAGSKVVYGTNTNVDSATTINDSIQAGTYAINITSAAERATITGSEVENDDITDSTEKTVSINGFSIKFNSVAGNAQATVANFVNAVNIAGIGIIASTDGAGTTITLNSDGYGASESITVTDGGANSASRLIGLTATADVSDTGVDIAGTINGAAATGSGKTLTSTAGASIGLKVTLTDAAASAGGNKGSVQVTKNNLTMHIGANEGQTMSVSISSMLSSDLGVDNLNLTSQAGAEDAITTVDEAIKRVSAERSKLGAYQNRLEHTIANLGTSSENLTAAESRIRDVDMAKEMMNYTKNNILTQAATAMLAQANQQPQSVLQLLQ